MYTPACACLAVHLKYQPSSGEWHCPKCKAGFPKFGVEKAADGAKAGCRRLHEEDDVVCLACKSSWSGVEIIRLIKAESHVENCPSCRGKGVITP